MGFVALFGEIFSFPLYSFPAYAQFLQASHLEQHQHVEVLSEHSDGGAERAVQQTVRPFQVLSVPQNENRVEVQRVPGSLSYSGQLSFQGMCIQMCYLGAFYVYFI